MSNFSKYNPFSRFGKSAKTPQSAFDQMVHDAVEQVKAGTLNTQSPDRVQGHEASPEVPPEVPRETLEGTPQDDGTASLSGDHALDMRSPSAASTQTKKMSQAERDMAAMKQAPDLRAMVRKDVVAGCIAIAVFVGFLGLWSSLAPLSSAAIAPGVISPYGSRKTVQHLEGGIIERILVEEGDRVEAGQTLVLLEDTMARASWQLIRTQYYTLAARHARLGALQSAAADIAFPDWLIKEAGDPDVASILATEINLLATRRLAHKDRKAVLKQRIVQLEKEIEGLGSQIRGQTRQLALIAQEIGGVQQLVDKGLERMPRLLSLQRNEAQIDALRGSNTAKVSRTEQAISETELEVIASDTVLYDEIAREMAEVQTQLSQAGERMAASGDILERIAIVAPVSGKVLDLKYHTAGGIIVPGAAILDIVPENEDLIIEARVSPMDIDVVYENLEAQIHLTAFGQRNIPMIIGTVRHVSADRLLDEITGEPYFKAIVEVSSDELARLGEGVTLISGMPAEVMIVTGEQTLFGYLLKPAVETLRHSFREG
jgi:HlyD family secretion protein/epimerase transport system membrane fusion protein